MFRDIVEDIFSPYSSFGDRCLAVFMALLLLVASGLVILLVSVLVDSVGVESTKTTATIVEMKQVVPAHTTIILVGKVPVPQYHPESYRLHFKIEMEEVSPSVEKKFFDDIKIGDRIEVDYGFGRLSHSPQPAQIRQVGK